MTPRVSVVMPVFNGERFIAEAIESVLASRFEDFELLVLIDGGTTDGSKDVAIRVAAADPRVRIIDHPHVAPSAARNIGLRAARGELVANLDCDDAMFPDRLGRQVAYLDRHPECVAVGSRVLVVDTDGTPVRVIIRALSHEDIEREHLEGRGGAMPNPGATFRRAAALAIDGYSADLKTTGEDYDFWLRLAEVGRLANLPDVLIRYRVHDKNASVGDAVKERRRLMALEILTRAFARRGITDRQPVLVKGPPRRLWERWSNRALLHHFSGDRARATVAALVTVLLQPTAAVARNTLSTVLRRPPPPHRKAAG
jgi:glycosyltransferase involved in cell wall biosynthesis